MPRLILALIDSRFSRSQRSCSSCVSRRRSNASSTLPAAGRLDLSLDSSFQGRIVDFDVHMQSQTESEASEKPGEGRSLIGRRLLIRSAVQRGRNQRLMLLREPGQGRLESVQRY